MLLSVLLYTEVDDAINTAVRVILVPVVTLPSGVSEGIARTSEAGEVTLLSLNGLPPLGQAPGCVRTCGAISLSDIPILYISYTFSSYFVVKFREGAEG